jgi:hypothetical protein
MEFRFSMSDNDEDLQASLRAHAERARTKKSERQDAAEMAKVQMESCRHTLSATIHPILEEYAQTMNAAGHEARLRQGDAGPLSEMLTIRLWKRQGHAVMSFTCEATGKLTMSKTTDLGARKAQAERLPHPLTPELARRLVKNWLKEILDTN